MQIIEHAESFEVRDDAGNSVRFFYFDEHPGRRAFSGRKNRKQAEQEAIAFAGTNKKDASDR